ncbi:MAG: hypothetical protein ACOVP8_13885, partial [Phycisphaerales bacterium]
MASPLRSSAIVARSPRRVASMLACLCMGSSVLLLGACSGPQHVSLGMLQGEAAPRSVTKAEISEALARGCEILVARQAA